MELSVVLLIPEKNAMRVVFPYPETIFLTPALETPPEIAEVRVRTDGPRAEFGLATAVQPDPKEVVACVWGAGNRTLATALVIRGGRIRIPDRVWVVWNEVYVPVDGKYVALNTETDEWREVKSPPGDAEEVRLGGTTGGRTDGGEHGGPIPVPPPVRPGRRIRA